MPVPDSTIIREMREADIAGGLALCRASRWNQTAGDWQHFLTGSPHGTLVAEQEGKIVGTVAMLPYGPFAWISMVLVDPAVRGRGLGTLLLERGLEYVPPGAVARLDATPAGEVLYRKLGFTAEYGLARWYRDKAPSPEKVAVRFSPPAPRARPIAEPDWPVIAQMDLRAFGASRLPLLRRLASEAPEYSWVFEGNGGHVRGYTFGRHGHDREHIGPLVAGDNETALALLGACLTSRTARGVFIDVPDAQRAWTEMLAGAGFAIERPFLRMHRGPLTTPGEPPLVRAIAGPEFG